MTNAILQSPHIYGQRSQLQNRGSFKVSLRSCTIQMFLPKCRVMQLRVKRDKISAVLLADEQERQALAVQKIIYNKAANLLCP